MHLADLAVIGAYLLFITWFGARFKENQRSLKDYFLGGRGAPWWAISLSIVSAETSTLTVIGTPAISFGGNFTFLQLIFGYLLGRFVISAVFLPQYFRGEMFTAYELMQRRFGPRVRKFAAATFFLLRALAEGLRVFAVSIVVAVVLGTGELTSIFVIVALTLFYTFEGGMTAVIWTDVVQMVLYIAGALASFFLMLHLIPGGWSHVVEVGQANSKFQVFDFHFSFSAAFFMKSYTFWAGLLGGCFLTTASHGTEQLLVQRLLSARNQAESRLALFTSWIVIFFQFTLFLTIGVLLFVYYGDTGRSTPRVIEQIYPQFIWNNFPPGSGRIGHRRHSRRSYVQSQCCPECARVHHDHGLPSAAASRQTRDLLPSIGEMGNSRVECRSFRCCAARPSLGTNTRIGAFHCFGSVWCAAWRVSAGCPDPASRRVGRDCRYERRIPDHSGHALPCCLYLVRFDRLFGHLPGWVRFQLARS